MILELKNVSLIIPNNPININNVDIDKIIMSNKVYFGKKSLKYFIGYKADGEEVKLLHITVPKMSEYIKS